MAYFLLFPLVLKDSGKVDLANEIFQNYAKGY